MSQTYQVFKLKVKNTVSNLAPFVSRFELQEDGSFLCGFSFAAPLLLKLKFNSNATNVKDVIDYKLEEALDLDGLAICGGLRGSPTGQSILSVLHKGWAPAFFRKMKKADLNDLDMEAYQSLLSKVSAGSGALLRHSIIELTENGTLKLRLSKEGGALLDVALVGDYVFGITGDNVWREPFLSPEKRESLRGDLCGNRFLHRDADSNMWLLGQNAKLYRLAQLDNRAKPTPLKTKLEERQSTFHFWQSKICELDGWLYAIMGKERNQLVRLRRNPESYEEEMQLLFDNKGPISSLAVLDRESKAKLYVALPSLEGAKILMADLVAPEDPEDMPPIPDFTDYAQIKEVPCLGQMLVDKRKRLWGAEGAFKKIHTQNSEQLNIVRI